MTDTRDALVKLAQSGKFPGLRLKCKRKHSVFHSNPRLICEYCFGTGYRLPDALGDQVLAVEAGLMAMGYLGLQSFNNSAAGYSWQVGGKLGAELFSPADPESRLSAVVAVALAAVRLEGA